MALEIEFERLDDIPVVRLTGELDIYTVPDFAEFAHEALAGYDAFVIDIDDVELIDSSGLGALLRLRQPWDTGPEITFICNHGSISRLLELANVADHFTVVGSRDEARRSFGRPH